MASAFLQGSRTEDGSLVHPLPHPCRACRPCPSPATETDGQTDTKDELPSSSLKMYIHSRTRAVTLFLRIPPDASRSLLIAPLGIEAGSLDRLDPSISLDDNPPLLLRESHTGLTHNQTDINSAILALEALSSSHHLLISIALQDTYLVPRSDKPADREAEHSGDPLSSRASAVSSFSGARLLVPGRLFHRRAVSRVKCPRGSTVDYHR